MNERISSAKACKCLVRTALEKFRLPYLTVTPTFSICPRHGYLDGEHVFCPFCDQERANEGQTNIADNQRQRCEVWTRVMGYHRPVSEFNPGKQGEHQERKHFFEPHNLQMK